ERTSSARPSTVPRRAVTSARRAAISASHGGGPDGIDARAGRDAPPASSGHPRAWGWRTGTRSGGGAGVWGAGRPRGRAGGGGVGDDQALAGEEFEHLLEFGQIGRAVHHPACAGAEVPLGLGAAEEQFGDDGHLVGLAAEVEPVVERVLVADNAARALDQD